VQDKIIKCKETGKTLPGSACSGEKYMSYENIRAKLTGLISDIEDIDADDETKAQFKEHLFLFQQAERAYNEERYDDGISILEMLNERIPDNINIKTLLAIAYDLTGHPIKYIRLVEEIYEILPGAGDFSLALAMAYRRQDWTQKALKQLKTTVELIPDNSLAWENLVDCSMEAEETHEAQMNCFGAMHILKEYGIESVRLNVYAFSFMILEDNDRADKYLTNIVRIMQSSVKHENNYYEDAIRDVLWEIDMAERYNFIPRIREMIDILPEISKGLAAYVEEVETKAEIIIMNETFPEVLCNIIELLDKDCDCDECERNLISSECSILVDHDGYKPELIRLSNEHPKLYSMHNVFFDVAVSGVNRDRLLKERLRILSDDDLEPILIRADGSEINPVVETYRREGRKIGRNELCPCGSGKKYKKCCGA